MITMDRMAERRGVHRITIVHWLAAARERLALQTRKLLVQRLRVNREELQSILRLVRSQVEVNLETSARTEPVHDGPRRIGSSDE